MLWLHMNPFLTILVYLTITIKKGESLTEKEIEKKAGSTDLHNQSNRINGTGDQVVSWFTFYFLFCFKYIYTSISRLQKSSQLMDHSSNADESTCRIKINSEFEDTCNEDKQKLMLWFEEENELIDLMVK